jgi:hypothetical protein
LRFSFRCGGRRRDCRHPTPIAGGDHPGSAAARDFRRHAVAGESLARLVPWPRPTTQPNRRDSEHQPVQAKAFALGLPQEAWQAVSPMQRVSSAIKRERATPTRPAPRGNAYRVD